MKAKIKSTKPLISLSPARKRKLERIMTVLSMQMLVWTGQLKPDRASISEHMGLLCESLGYKVYKKDIDEIVTFGKTVKIRHDLAGVL